MKEACSAIMKNDVIVFHNYPAKTYVKVFIGNLMVR